MPRVVAESALNIRIKGHLLAKTQDPRPKTQDLYFNFPIRHAFTLLAMRQEFARKRLAYRFLTHQAIVCGCG